MAGKPISLDSFRKRKEQKIEQKQVGKLVWLRCPTCNTIEYTEIIAPNGRSHSCGMQVQEVEVEVDFRAELTIINRNLQLIEELIAGNKSSPLKKMLVKTISKTLKLLKTTEEEYLHRINVASNYQAVPYEGSFEELEPKLPIRKRDALGLYLSEFRFAPDQRFKPASG